MPVFFQAGHPVPLTMKNFLFLLNLNHVLTAMILHLHLLHIPGILLNIPQCQHSQILNTFNIKSFLNTFNTKSFFFVQADHPVSLTMKNFIFLLNVNHLLTAMILHTVSQRQQWKVLKNKLGKDCMHIAWYGLKVQQKYNAIRNLPTKQKTLRLHLPL